MKSLPTLFFATAAVFALVGMAWGIQMSASHDHTLSPAHGHLNLIGFVSMAVFGTYYALSPHAAQSTMAKAHYALTVLSVLVLVPGIAFAINGDGEVLAKVGSVLAVLSMGVFAFMVLRHGVGADPRASAAHLGQPAE